MDSRTIIYTGDEIRLDAVHQSSATRYTVVGGVTPSGIASKYRVTLKDLFKADSMIMGTSICAEIPSNLRTPRT